jgi:hypothetical protein
MMKKKQKPQSCQTDVSSSALLVGFRVDTMALLHEIANCGIPTTAGVLKVPLNVFKNLLARVAERAIVLNDPELNILMLSLNLYEVPVYEIPKAIENQMSLVGK